MILYEYEAKRLFREQGISIPQGEVIRTPEEAEEVVRKMGKPAMVKPQVLAGWWGKARDIQFANTPVLTDPGPLGERRPNHRGFLCWVRRRHRGYLYWSGGWDGHRRLNQQVWPAGQFFGDGGGITEKQLADVMRLILKKPGLRAVFLNMYGGINPIHEGAKGIVKVIREDKVTIPIVAKGIGNFQEETWKTLEEGGVTVIKTIPTDGAVEELFKRLKK